MQNHEVKFGKSALQTGIKFPCMCVCNAGIVGNWQSCIMGVSHSVMWLLCQVCICMSDKPLSMWH